MRQITAEIGEKLMEQGQQAGQAVKQAPKTIFQRMIGKKFTDTAGQPDDQDGRQIEKSAAGGSQQQASGQTDASSQQQRAENEAKRQKMINLLHKRIKAAGVNAYKQAQDKERMRLAKQEEDARVKQQKKVEEIQQAEKRQDLAVINATRERGAGEFGPKQPK